MELVEIIAEVLKYIAPAVIVLVAFKFVNDAQTNKEQSMQQNLVRSEMLKQHLPLKLTAYERAVLFLERITPTSLLPRNGHGDSRSAQQFHLELIHDIRSEFEHNLAQQIYISHHAWAELVQAKEEMISIINNALQELNEEANGIELSKKIIEKISASKSIPTHKAIFVLKTDIHELFKV